MKRNIKPILSELDINYQLYRDGQEQQLADTKKGQTLQQSTTINHI